MNKLLLGLLLCCSGLLMAGNIVPPGPYSGCSLATMDTYTGNYCAVGNPADGWVYFDWKYGAQFYVNNSLVGVIFAGTNTLTGDGLSNESSKMVFEQDITLIPPPSVLQGFGFSSNEFEVWGIDKAVYVIEYKVDPFPPSIPGFEVDMDVFSPENGGIATIITEICADGLIGFGCPTGNAFTLTTVYETNPANQVIQQVLNAQAVFANPAQLVDVRHTIILDARGGSSQIQGMSSNVVNTVVPEPGSMLLGGAGLGLLLLLRRRSA